MYFIPQYILQPHTIMDLQNTTLPCFMPSYFTFNALWLVYFHLFNFFFPHGNIVFYLCLFIYTHFFRKKLGHTM